LLYGDLPSSKQLLEFNQKVTEEMLINQKLLDFYKGFALNAHPMSIMTSIAGALSSFIHDTLDVHSAV
jgi:citrate synthase